MVKAAIDSLFADRKKQAVERLVGKENAIAITETKNKKQAFFPNDPFAFNPQGLVRRVYVEVGKGKNGGIIKWQDPVTKNAVFEWDEDYVNGSHYHALLIEWDSAHNGMHYLPGEPVPEPWNSLYFQ